MLQALAIIALLLTVIVAAPACDPGIGTSHQTAGNPQNTGGWITEPTTPSNTAPSGDSNNLADDKWVGVRRTLDAWKPSLLDETGDAADEVQAHDIRSAVLVVTQDEVLIRYELGAEMKGNDKRDLRFWLEQKDNFLSVEAKTDSMNNACSIVVAGGSAPASLGSCFNASGKNIDISIPRSEIPSIIDPKKDFWLSRPQVCCMDAERTEPIDELDASQVAWRPPLDAQSSTPPSPQTGGAPPADPAQPGPPPPASPDEAGAITAADSATPG